MASIAKAGSRGGLVAGPVTRASSTCAGSRRRWLFRPAAPRAHDTRCPSRSGWGEALAARNRGERCRVAKAVRPLARETSAGAVLKRERAARLVSSGGSAPPGRVYPGGRASARVGPVGRASVPLAWRGFDLAGARNCAEEGNLQGADRGSGGRAVVLADCIDCRNRRAALGPRLRAPGLASAAPARSPSGARDGLHHEAKPRRVPVEAPDRAARAAREPGRGSTRRWKAPWSYQAVAFDEAVVEAGLVARGSGGRPRGRRRARRVATEGVRGHVACSVRGREHRDRERLPEGLSIAAPPGPGGAVLGWNLGPKPPDHRREVATKPKLEGRRQAKLHPARNGVRTRLRPRAGGRSAERHVTKGPRGSEGSATGNRWIRRVLVSSVGCRSR